MVRFRDQASRCNRWLPWAVLLIASQAVGAPVQVPNHLIISEVVTVANAATNRPLCSEYVEILNPTPSAIDMSEYYLTDARFTTNGLGYWRIAEDSPSSASAGGGTFGDFHVRFPDGYNIAAGDTIVVAIGGSAAYSAAYSRLPDFELFEDSQTPDFVPELVEVFPHSVNAGFLVGGTNTVTLTDTSESLSLYRWDGISDLVQDVDYMRWGTVASVIVDKTGVSVGAGTYLADTAATSQQTVSASVLAFGAAYARWGADEGAESPTNGNGLTGHNETSENFAATWHVVAQQPPLGQVESWAPAPIITDASHVPAAPAVGEPVVVSVTARSSPVVTSVLFQYSVDDGAFQQLVGGVTGANTWSATIPAQSTGAVVEWYAVVTNERGASAVYPAAAPRFTDSWTTMAPLPIITGAVKFPAASCPYLPVTLAVTANSVSPLSGAVFHYSVDGGTFMQLTGSSQSGGVYTATVPGQADGAWVRWYVVVSNEDGASATSPVGAPATTHYWYFDSTDCVARSWDISADFSLTENPNGAWSYGRKWTPESAGFDLMTENVNNEGWWFGNWGHGAPNIRVNANMWAKDNSNGLPAIRWTCPAAGIYSLTGRFLSVDPNGGDVFAYVTVNNAISYSARLIGYEEMASYALQDVYLAAGDVVDFQIAWGGSVYYESGWTMVYADIIAAQPAMIGWCSLPGATTLNVASNGVSDPVYGTAWIDGLTNQTGPAAGLIAELGWGPSGVDPSVNSGAWHWTPAAYDSDAGDDDVFVASIAAPMPGEYDYTFRFRFNADTWIYADGDGSVNGYAPNQAGTLVVGSASGVPAAVPVALRLYPSQPNPFNPMTTIRFDLPVAGLVRLAIYDVAGRRVRMLAESNLPAGSHHAIWDGRDGSGRSVASGSYVARLEFCGKVETVRMGLVR